MSFKTKLRMGSAENHDRNWIKIASVIGSLIALVVSVRSCCISEKTEKWASEQVELLRKDIEASNKPLIHLFVEVEEVVTTKYGKGVGIIHDLYLINNGKGSATDVFVTIDPAKIVGGWGQKEIHSIAPGDRIKVFRIQLKDPSRPVKATVQYQDIFGELYVSKYEGNYRNLNLKERFNAKDKLKRQLK
jgi:hypothetical protein